ncbi:MAG: 50S ribosomal protein L6 [Microgenomates group bacterium GW2011_GWC1_43_13]|uniref:Large ribosomal subunit protein uL6 n=3 Tax=Candidatus Woeseibacteriota TaxID=1752722 RepID=A0A837I9U3_9BACT|nr:MAG: 50S ribosomal protein L6 [Microgenomates group bacterium GW2011_GWC1_43_13]KKT33550.1 MAG: 50S ribosomal protein L6 [Candidatus Woesebacteria bacterium GW2011_GWB1_44_11]KKT55039.1 MAG: 50S ribosomal protein L6 [Candidatus Woesebacteria bacterium GW2011_GWA1_44_23]OGM76851.1 MAG: 50S ribosomal protein L6 [Candidatus Woesebacteria bacterium RIFOXYA1_FULL_43_16]OGM83246.1 MAG: 50S ribosomal protein L6 [Candidatus Woesebacteria bacterium RIFOXYB1_FULL_42_36]OGM85046.1 MAG: 50S ribosomal p
MSKIGRQPILIPVGVTVEVSGHTVKVVGPKGTLEKHFPPEINVEVKDGEVIVTAKGSVKYIASLYGTTRALINNDVKGVSEGWFKKLELVGTGFKAEVIGKTISLTVGYNHPVKVEAPEGISFKVEKTIVTVEGINKEVVGQVAAIIRGVRPPEPYKGKGIKYVDEVIRRKAGKAAAAKAGPAA